jgi:hypothetical protein
MSEKHLLTAGEEHITYGTDIVCEDSGYIHPEDSPYTANLILLHENANLLEFSNPTRSLRKSYIRMYAASQTLGLSWAVAVDHDDPDYAVLADLPYTLALY